MSAVQLYYMTKINIAGLSKIEGVGDDVIFRGQRMCSPIAAPLPVYECWPRPLQKPHKAHG